MSLEAFLGRVLNDPVTGLPNLPYFRMIRDWEERRGARRGYGVRVLRIDVTGGDEPARRSLPWRLCQALRSCDLVASDGTGHYRVLLTSPDAEQSEAIAERIRSVAEQVNARLPDEQRLHVAIESTQSAAPPPQSPCEPRDEDAFADSGEGPAVQGADEPHTRKPFE